MTPLFTIAAKADPITGVFVYVSVLHTVHPCRRLRVCVALPTTDLRDRFSYLDMNIGIYGRHLFPSLSRLHLVTSASTRLLPQDQSGNRTRLLP